MPKLEPPIVCTAHFEPGWLRANGPARCKLCGFVDKTGRRIDPINGRRLDCDRDLLYTTLEDETVVFLPKKLAASMRDARVHLATCHTWGQAREQLTDEWYKQLIESHGAGTPDDTEPLDGPSIADEWPSMTHRSMIDHLPRDVVRKFGETYHGLFDSGVTFPQERTDEMIQALARRPSFHCTEDDRIEELLDLS